MPSTLGIVSSNYVELPPPTFTGQTVLRLEGEGTNGSNNNLAITDVANSFTVTKTGTILSTRAPFAGAGGSIYFNGSTDRLSLPNNTAFDLGSTYTVEFWIYQDGPDGGHIFGMSPAVVNYFKQLYFTIGSTGKVGVTSRRQTGDADNTIKTVTSNASILYNQWNHVAFSVNASTCNIYINGQFDKTGAVNNYVFSTNTSFIQIGHNSNGHLTSYFKGYLSNFRITKGVALYTGTGTITVPTPLTPSANTSLLLNAPLPSIFDSSPKQQLISTAGNAQISTAQKKNGNGSIYFDGAGDVLKIPHSSDFLFGSKDFMVATWVYNLDTSGTRTIFSKRSVATSSKTGFVVYISSGVYRVAFFASSGDVGIIGPAAKLNTWEHIALIRQGGTVTFYVDGRVKATQTLSGSISDSTTASVTIGADSDSTTYFTNCYLDDFVVMTNP